MSGWFKQRQTPQTTRSIGATAEDLASAYLEKNGLTLLTRNYHCRRGEIDLIMQDGNFLVFIEVRYRRNDHYGSAAESVTRQKQQRLLTTAEYYLQNEKQDADRACRFDVITLSGQQEPQIEWIKDAFQAN
jgi:putative endonuclease